MKKAVVLQFVAIIGSLIFSANTVFPQEKPDTVKKEITANSDFEQEKTSLLKSFEEEKKQLSIEKKKVEEELEKTKTEIQEIGEAVSSKTLAVKKLKFPLDIIKAVVLPGGTLTYWISFAVDINSIFFFITVFNVLLYFYFREKELFKKYRRVILIILGITLFLSIPAFGAEATDKETAKKRHDPLLEEIKIVNKILKWTELERSIHILENKIKPVINLPKIKTKNPFLKPWNIVPVKSPEYFFTLAALYYENNQKSKANETLMNVIDFPAEVYWDTKLKDRYNNILMNTIFFYMEKKMTSSASEVSQQTIKIIKDVPVLLKLSDFLYQKNMHDSAGGFLNRAMEITSRSSDYLKLADFLIERKRTQDAVKLVEKSIKATKNLEEVIEIIKFGLSKNFQSSVETGIDKGLKLCKSSSDYIDFAKFLIESKRIEDTSRTIKQASNYISSAKDVEKMREDFLKLAEFALQNNFYQEAGDSIEKLWITLKKRKYNFNPHEFRVPPPLILDFENSLPGDEKISLSVYFGAIRQKSGLADVAQKYYEKAVIHDLEKIEKSFGEQIEANPNNFFYLKNLLKMEGKTKRWKEFEPLYARVEKEYLAKITEKQAKEIKELKANAEKELKDIKSSIDENLISIKELKSEKFSLNAKIFINTVRIPFYLVFVFLVTAGIISKSLLEAGKTTRFKVFSFLWKFKESTGWFYILTILGIPLGIILVFIGQLFGNIARIQQDEEKSVVLLEQGAS